MTIDALPTVPSTASPTTFATDMDTFLAALPTFRTQANALSVAMTAVAAGGAVSLQYTFSTTTTDADPGAGILRLDAATQNTATTIRADLLGNDTSDYSGVLALLDDSTSTNKGYITLRHATTPTKWLVFAVASLASPSGYKNVTVTCAASSAASPFTDGDSILLDFSPTGDKGTTGATGTGITEQAVGFTVTGGTTSKTLTVALDASVSGDNTGDNTLGAGVATFLATPTIANLNAALSDADAAILGANTFTGAQTLGENTALVLGAALSADGKYTGIVQAGTAAAALAFGELCYKVTASGKWNKASGAAANVNTVVAAGQLGICVLAAAGDASATTMLMYGNVRADGLFDTFTVGAALYMSAATAGKIVSAAPTGTTDFTVRKIGMAEDANTVFFCPSNDYVTLV